MDQVYQTCFLPSGEEVLVLWHCLCSAVAATYSRAVAQFQMATASLLSTAGLGYHFPSSGEGLLRPCCMSVERGHCIQQCQTSWSSHPLAWCLVSLPALLAFAVAPALQAFPSSCLPLPPLLFMHPSECLHSCDTCIDAFFYSPKWISTWSS